MFARTSHPQIPHGHTSFVKHHIEFTGLADNSMAVMRGRLMDEVFKRCIVDSKADLENRIRMLMSLNLDDLRYPYLNEELGKLIPPSKVSYDRLLKKSSEEYTAARSLSYSFADEVRAGLPPSELLLEIRRRLGLHAGYRHGPIWIVNDFRGNNVKFPPHELVPMLLAAMDCAHETLRARSPSLAAIAAYLGVIHAHPFDDGNGRCSRILVNILLNSDTPLGFIPLYGFMMKTIGAFLVNLRRALYFNDLPAFIGYAQEAFSVWASLSDRPVEV